MAKDKKKSVPSKWNNTAPIDWSVRVKDQNQDLKQNVLANPAEFDKVAPVTRPDVPEIDEQLPPEATDNSFLGGFLNIMDNIVPDDMGGLVRGQSGWMSNVPLYKETVGAAVGVPLSAAESVINVVNWGSEQMNHLGAALFSALPGGIQTLDWEQSQNISLGQVAVANAAINNSKGVGGFLINAATFQMPFAGLAAIGKQQDPENILYSDKFDILDKEQRADAFESGGMGQITSGFADAIWMVAADPTILGGKLTTTLRLGTKMGEFGGLTNQALRSSAQIERFARVTDEQAQLIAQNGIEGARKSGNLTAEGENLIRAMEQNADELVNHPWVRSSPNQRDTRALLGATSVENPQEAAALVGAMAGNSDAWVKLRDLNADMYVRLADSLGVDVFDSMADTKKLGDLSTDAINIGDDIVYERLGTRQDLLTELKLTGQGSIDPKSIAAGQLITRGGSRLGPRTTRAANAWRTGAQRAQFNNNAFKKTSSSVTRPGDTGHFVYDTIEGIAGSRPLKIVRWLGQGTPRGVISTKDGADSPTVLRDVTSWLRKSPISDQESALYLNRFAAARTFDERTAILKEMEQEAARLIAIKHGVSESAAMAAYDSYAAKRAALMSTVRKSETKFAVDDDGKLVKVPDFYAELEPAYAMLDTQVFNRVIGGNLSWMRTVEDVEFIGDELNKYWKLSVLLRLGYTQRNIAEGALRSFAVLGLIASNPVAFAKAPANAFRYMGAKKAIRNSRNYEKSLITAYENLQETRKLLDEGLGVARYDEMMNLRKEAEIIAKQIDELEKSPKVNSKKLKKLEEALDSRYAKSREIEEKFLNPMLPELNANRAKILEQQKEIDQIAEQIDRLLAVARSKTAARKRGGYAENVINGQKLAGAFQGSEGAMAAKLSSADRTTYTVIDSAFGRMADALENSPDFKVIDPATLKPGQLKDYFNEYAMRINYRYREDPVGRMILSDTPVDDIKLWLKSDAGKKYRDNLSISDRRLNTEQEINGWIDHLIRRLDNEMPMDTKLRQLALDHELTPAEVAAALRGRELPTIVGRLADDVPTSFISRGKRGVDTITDAIMKGIGSFPETKLLRHPFYNRVYMDKQAQLWRLASEQGADMANPIVKNRINRVAHQTAMKSTRETMYTIEELSNAAVLLRYISPFFPAFENSLRTWGRIAWYNPAVVGEGNILWNIPNNLGWVVDENGEKVEHSNFFKDENNFIIWPEAVANVLRNENIPFTPGEALRTRQAGLNVIFQGGTWWFPGAGPATAIPLSVILRGKPEDAEVLRSVVGDEIFQQITVGGNPNADLLDALLPTFGRRVRQMLAGESTDQAFLTTWNQIIEDQYITAQLEGRPFTEKDAQIVQKKLDRFWKWQIGASITAPAQSAIMSKYQVQRDAWGRLIDDQSLSYDQKLKKFNEMFPDFGDALMAITRSGSYTETKLNPNLETWQRIYKNKDLVNNLYAIDPELVGMFGNMGTFNDPFSRAVYGEFGSMKIGPNDARVRRQMKPDEIIRNNQIKDGWSEYWLIKDDIEDKAIRAGYSSLQVKDAKPLRDILDAAAEKLAERYPAWGEERKTYQDKLPAFIQGARMIVQNGELIDEDSTVRALSDYLEVREYISDQLSLTDNDDARDQLKLIGYEAAWKLRQQDVGFADFYDQYLYRDDFRKI